jgi:2,5-diketo-D-gluconate reductase A
VTVNASPTTTDGTARVLADGRKLPLLGLGLWQVPDGPECVKAVRWALEAGYRHIDTAQAYRNEASVGKALRESGLGRDEVFLTTKFSPWADDPVGAAEQSLRRLGTEYIDLYLVHSPRGGPTWAWPGMEHAAELGYAHSIGVSNFDEAEVACVTANTSRMPAVNQVNFNPFANRRALLAACQRRNIALEAYSPLGTGRLLSDATVTAIAAGIGRTPAQVLLRWSVQRGIPVISKSTHQNRIAENMGVFGFELTDEAMSQLDALDKTDGTGIATERKWWAY